MSVTLALGAQWGDEGKGKIVDFLSQKADFIIRFNGGNNAGHTIVNKTGSFSLHLIPSGIFSKNAINIIANGVVVDLETLVEEITSLEKKGVRIKGKLFISPMCHIILPYHKVLEKVYEKEKGNGKTGTTGRGIGPVNADKVSYNGIRLWDMFDRKVFSEKLKIQLLVKNKILKAFGEEELDQKEIEEKYSFFFGKIRPYIRDTYTIVSKAVSDKKTILLESAQGALLDNDWGMYPFVTAATIVSGGITQGAGIPIKGLSETIGITKAYATRVGSGPFPTELPEKEAENLRKLGAEFGATTGRPRRCGWLDLELLKFAVDLNGISCLAITKLDILDSFSEIKACIGYKLGGKKIKYPEMDAVSILRAKPIYKTFPGWKKKTGGIRKYEELPQEAKKYLAFIENAVGVKAKYISTGPAREEIILRNIKK